MIDLHAHTTASDSSFTPSELIALAREIGLNAVGITDHDTIAGWEEAFQAGASSGVEIVPGIELSTAYEGGRFHLLGYYIDPHSELMSTLEWIQAARANRGVEILNNLRALGMPLEEDEVRAFSGGEFGQIGRPHFAQAMVARGYVSSTQEAFELYLAEGKPAYAPKAVLTPRDAIAGIHDAGGVAVWAHPPHRTKLSLDELETRLREWIDWGLDGLEVAYSQYTPAEAAWTLAMQERYGLLGTGGSDFHGRSKSSVRLGVTHTGRPLPDSILTELKRRRDLVRSAMRSKEQ
jgi:predicted metal-dependent phosphoesterase TrpH